MDNLNYCEGTVTTAIWRPYQPWVYPCPCERTCPHCGGTGRVPVHPRPRPWRPEPRPMPPYIDTRPICKPPYDPTRGKRY